MATIHATHAEHLERERSFHDKQAREIKITPGEGGWIDCELPAWPNDPKISRTMTRRALDILGDVAGKRVLVLGCGFDPGPTWFARRRARVSAIDISPESIKDQRILMEAYKVCIDLRVADALHAPFPDASFDVITGNAILHHLDTEEAAREIARLLAPGGVALFREVQAGFFPVRMFRQLTPRWRLPGQHPLTAADYRILKRHFRTVNITAHVFTSMAYLFVHRMVAFALDVTKLGEWPKENEGFLRLCDRMDRALARVPGMSSQMWYSLIELRNDE